MLIYRLDTEEYLARAVEATSVAYAGLIVVLARTAEARRTHQELTRDWVSLHDVTGRHVAVLCPAPSRTESSQLFGGYGRVAESAGLQLNIRDNRSRHKFDEAFFVGLDQRHAGRPGTPEEHWNAWSEAAGRCARYFGIPENRLPAILFLSFVEGRAVLIHLPEYVSLYSLCKVLTSSLDAAFREIDQTADELRRLEEQVKRMNNRDYVTADKAFKTWQKLVCKLDDQLSQAGEMDRDLVANVRASLRSLTETKSAGALSEQLVCLHRAARPPVRHSLVWAVLQRLNEGPPQDPSREGRQIALSGLEADIRAVTKRSIELAHKLRLADTLYESCAELFEGVHLNTIEGVAALTGWKIDLIEDHGPRPFALTERRG